MKIGDQKPVAPPVPGVDSPPENAAPTEGAGFAEQLQDVPDADSVDGADGAGAAGPLGDLDALAARIDRGELGADEAMELIVERVLDSQLGPDSPVGLRDQARSLVQQALESDPHLIALTRRLGGD